MTSSLVGSEMCIRDRIKTPCMCLMPGAEETSIEISADASFAPREERSRTCLLYTSDAADDM
eukprot:1360927-Prorocentrum_lima.AAC.1